MKRRTVKKATQRDDMEKHTQTILASIITAILIWVGVTVNLSRVDLARLETKMSSFEDTVKDIRTDQYKAGDAIKDFALRDAQIKIINDHLQAIDNVRNK